MMVPDFHTNPIQGKLFRLIRNMILNLNDEDAKNIICVDKLTIMEDHNNSNDRDKMTNHCRSVSRKAFKSEIMTINTDH